MEGPLNNLKQSMVQFQKPRKVGFFIFPQRVSALYFSMLVNFMFLQKCINSGAFKKFLVVHFGSSTMTIGFSLVVVLEFLVILSDLLRYQIPILTGEIAALEVIAGM